jgi:phosphate transport system permease protein
VTKKRLRFLGLTLDDTIKAFFGGNALVAVVILTLITFFLVREGAGFFGQNRLNLEVYRRSGLEYVDLMRRQSEDHTALTRYLSDLRLRLLTHYTAAERLSSEQANAKLAEFDGFADRYAAAVDPLRSLVSDLSEQATAIKTKFIVEQDREEERRQLLAAGKTTAAAAVKVEPVNFEAELKPVLGQLPAYREAAKSLREGVEVALTAAPSMPSPETRNRLQRFVELSQSYTAGFPAVVAALETWDFRRPVPFWEAFTAFCFGRQWLTASFWQDWYGILPLLTGSLLVSVVALLLAVPFGVGAAIYVNQLASRREQLWIKPSIEFIAALPSVVLGFFGIAVLGQLLRTASQSSWLAWMPGFPYSERLNVLTAGCLLALIAVPTIFTLAEDAINNVPRAFKEASFALGASRLQTIIRIIVPAALVGYHLGRPPRARPRDRRDYGGAPLRR